MLIKYDFLLKVLELESFSKAAENLGYTQSSVSQTVSQLESEFGFRLLQRNRGSISLTPEGRDLLPYIKAAADNERMIEKKVSDIRNLLRGEVNIGAYHSVACVWLPEIIKGFGGEHPDVKINIIHGNSGQLEKLMDDNEVDCCIMDVPASKKFESCFLYKDRYKVVLPKDHPEASGKVYDISKLAGNPVAFVREGKGLFLIKDTNEDGNMTGARELYTTDDDAFLSMVENGLGIGLISEMSLYRNPYKVAVLDTSEPIYRNLGLVFRDKKSLSPAVSAFINHILENNYYMSDETEENIRS